MSKEKEKTRDELLKEISELKARVKELEARVKELDVPYREVIDKLYWLEFGIRKLVFTDYDNLVDCLFEFREEDSDAEVVLWELYRTEEQMKAGDMRIKLPDILGEGIQRAKIKRQERLIRELLTDELEITRIASIVGVDEERIKEIQKELKK